MSQRDILYKEEQEKIEEEMNKDTEENFEKPPKTSENIPKVYKECGITRGKSKFSKELREEKAAIPGRLSGFLIWQSILILAFAEIMGKSYLLSQALSVLGLLSALFGIGNFWSLPSRIDALEGRKDKGIRRLIRRMFQGRGLGIVCSIIFTVFWVYAIKWSFFL